MELVAASDKESPLRSLSIPEAPTYYTTDQLGVDVFIQPAVVQRLVCAGSLVALSRDTFIDRDNVVALLPRGEHLSLARYTFPAGGVDRQVHACEMVTHVNLHASCERLCGRGILNLQLHRTYL